MMLGARSFLTDQSKRDVERFYKKNPEVSRTVLEKDFELTIVTDRLYRRFTVPAETEVAIFKNIRNRRYSDTPYGQANPVVELTFFVSPTTGACINIMSNGRVMLPRKRDFDIESLESALR